MVTKISPVQNSELTTCVSWCDQNKDEVSQVIINTAVLLSSFGKTKVWKFKTNADQSCTNHLFNTQPAWSKSDQAFSRENPDGVYNVSNATKHGGKQWRRCEPGLGKLTTEEMRDCSLVFGRGAEHCHSFQNGSSTMFVHYCWGENNSFSREVFRVYSNGLSH